MVEMEKMEDLKKEEECNCQTLIVNHLSKSTFKLFLNVSWLICFSHFLLVNTQFKRTLHLGLR